ncbi:hypothetical protein FF100_31680 [Methylobacterium terricola]|uniref:Uncharacterized protein n=1 Tax=Methylobacterium terricola TaxID=2583531 RepID=A0A5C4L906_9HYPH|nr:hypothetical protein [Methylobacterium terricola]TNC07644.1 hypothetical protein FF100_31680 [Methylobacterium terricola]
MMIREYVPQAITPSDTIARWQLKLATLADNDNAPTKVNVSFLIIMMLLGAPFVTVAAAAACLGCMFQ